MMKYIALFMLMGLLGGSIPTCDRSVDLNVDSTTMLIIVPPGFEPITSYMIEIFPNGIMFVYTGQVSDQFYWEEFAGVKEDVFENVTDLKLRILTTQQINSLNDIVKSIDVEKIDKEFSKASWGEDIDNELLWMNKKAYYIIGAAEGEDRGIKKLIKKIEEYSGIDATVRMTE